ncbi:hypothetical protein DASB73_016440 [Starmerella bacillaris]|uniref:Uncharacterized protein n=1 Tax=Starmerella bacillaris TaxID=1247836 RepID=A0AAV5RGG0_STABA|nr:hypothetical protein DASB73_016440 [Starmerella bacillaris]
MIAGLQSLALDRQLLIPVDLDGATVGVSAEVLANLDSAEITARFQTSAPHITRSAKNSEPSVEHGTSSSTKATKYIIVFDGPVRTSESSLSNGLVLRRVMKAVIEANAPFIVAPGLAAAQIAYMYSEGFITHAAGSDDVFLFGDVPLVVNLFGNSRPDLKPQLLQRRTLFASLNINETMFLEAAIGAGCAAHDQFIPLKESNVTTLEAAVISGQYSGDGSFFKAASRLAPNLQLELIKTLTFIIRQPILLKDGNVVLGNRYNQKVPQDIVEVVGRQLPAELYWYINKGLLGPEYPHAAIYDVFSDYFSSKKATKSLETETLDRLMVVEEALQSIRQQTYSLLCQNLHRYFQNKPVRNDSIGGADFTRFTPRIPELSSSEASDPQLIVKYAVEFVKNMTKLADLDKTNDHDVPELFARRSIPEGSLNDLVVDKVQLAFRELAEVVICYLMSKEVIPRTVDTHAIVLALPW